MAPDIDDLQFIGDTELQENLKLDRESCRELARTGHWKAATVLGGSIIEALLLWRLMQESNEDIVIERSKLGTDPGNDLEWWSLGVLINVAASLEQIGTNTVIVCKLAQNFRNLIHPGRSQRLNQQVNEAMTLSVMSAVEFVITDFQSG